MDRPPPEDIARVTAALGVRPIAWEPATRGGQTAAARWLVTLPDAARAFVKIGATLDTAAWIRDEHRVYAQLRGRSFLPRMLGFHDDGERPALAIEDLSGARWPPPWEPEAVTAVLACLDEVHATPPPTDLPSIGQLGLELRGTWGRIAEAPTPLLDLGLCDASWLEAALPVLESATRRAVIDGDALLHMDVRSDNLCLRDGRAVLVDWNWACTGNPMFEIAGWLPSLHDEGGPPPQKILPSGAAEMAALLAGYFCSHAGLPPIPGAPHVRHLQLRQARIALPWAARELGLPPPG
jgi:aminoglycoside phosphotransferase (APT) family kinase protein